MEEERLVAEALRLKTEKDAFDKYCKDLGITAEEGYKRKAAEFSLSRGLDADTVISAVLNRNKWTEKLIVCDLTGGILRYNAELALWYRLNHMKEKNLQFVFFNDGDSLEDDQKRSSVKQVAYIIQKQKEWIASTILLAG